MIEGVSLATPDVATLSTLDEPQILVAISVNRNKSPVVPFVGVYVRLVAPLMLYQQLLVG
jgi:hypothetical protein